MKLGELLVREGRISEAHIERALTVQARDGGRFGTVLCDIKAVDLDTLTVYLGVHLGIPIATGLMLERAKKSAVRLLTPTQAFRHRCVPLMVQDGQLIVAVENPHAFDTLDALAETTGHRVIPRVAPELRIYYYLERYYGVPRPARFLRYGDEPRGDDMPASGTLPSAPLPGLPPRHTDAVPRTGAVQLHRAATAMRFDDSEAVELDAADLVDALEQELSTRMVTDEQIDGTIPPPPATVVTRAAAPPLDYGLARETIDNADDRTQVAMALLGYASTLFEMALLFVVRDGMAFGWNFCGPIKHPEHVGHVLLPLDVSSMVKSAVVAEDHIFDGDLLPNALHAHLFRLIGYPEPKHAIAATVQLKTRVVNVLVGHCRNNAALGEVQRLELSALCTAAAGAYGRLIKVKKR